MMEKTHRGFYMSGLWFLLESKLHSSVFQRAVVGWSVAANNDTSKTNLPTAFCGKTNKRTNKQHFRDSDGYIHKQVTHKTVFV